MLCLVRGTNPKLTLSGLQFSSLKLKGLTRLDFLEALLPFQRSNVVSGHLSVWSVDSHQVSRLSGIWGRVLFVVVPDCEHFLFSVYLLHSGKVFFCIRCVVLRAFSNFLHFAVPLYQRLHGHQFLLDFLQLKDLLFFHPVLELLVGILIKRAVLSRFN